MTARRLSFPTMPASSKPTPEPTASTAGALS
jgi:hypothetical protein